MSLFIRFFDSSPNLHRISCHIEIQLYQFALTSIRNFFSDSLSNARMLAKVFPQIIHTTLAKRDKKISVMKFFIHIALRLKRPTSSLDSTIILTEEPSRIFENLRERESAGCVKYTRASCAVVWMSSCLLRHRCLTRLRLNEL